MHHIFDRGQVFLCQSFKLCLQEEFSVVKLSGLCSVYLFSFQTYWQTLWVTPCRTQTSSCSPTANNSAAMSICPSPSTALHPPPHPLPPPLPPPRPPHSLAIFRTTTALIAWRHPVIPLLSPCAMARVRDLEL